MKILIDNGHGIDIPGKRSLDGVLREYVWNRLIAARIVDRFLSLGLDAKLHCHLRCKTVSEQVCHRLADALRSIGLRPRLPHIKGKAVKRLRRKH